jgi:putative Holliday junction resolvase
MKKLALDIGDRWIGIAISDILGIIARPHGTVENDQLAATITALLHKERIDTIVVGYPKTMRGTESDQTKKIVARFEELKLQFPQVTWKLWDERMTSKQAEQIQRAKTPQEKIKSHSIAAAIILTTYLDHLEFQKFTANLE